MSRLFSSVHRKNAAILALALLGAIPYGWPAVASLALGGGIQVANLSGLDRSVKLFAGLAAQRHAGAAQALLVLRFLVLIAVVGFVLWRLPVQVIPFAVGLSTVIPAVLWQGLDSARGGLGPDRQGRA